MTDVTIVEVDLESPGVRAVIETMSGAVEAAELAGCGCNCGCTGGGA